MNAHACDYNFRSPWPEDRATESRRRILNRHREPSGEKRAILFVRNCRNVDAMTHHIQRFSKPKDDRACALSLVCFWIWPCDADHPTRSGDHFREKCPFSYLFPSAVCLTCQFVASFGDRFKQSTAHRLCASRKENRLQRILFNKHFEISIEQIFYKPCTVLCWAGRSSENETRNANSLRLCT